MSATAQSPVVVSVGDVAGLVEMVPSVLGFVPSSPSLVLFLVGADSRMIATVRLDAGDVEGLASVGIVARRHSVARCVVIGYDMPGMAGQTSSFAARAARALAAAGIEVHGIAQVCGDRWREGLSGTWRPASEVISPARAALTVAGYAPAGSREEFRARLLPGPVAHRALGQRWAARRMGWPEQLAALARCLVCDEQPRPRVAAAAAEAFGGLDRGRRDAILAALLPGLDQAGVDPETMAQARAGLGEVPWLPQLPGRVETARAVRLVSAVPESMAVGPLLLAALMGWAGGSGALAGDALARVLVLDPGNTLAEILMAIIGRGATFDEVTPGAGRRW
jgi:hypothetical protein